MSDLVLVTGLTGYIASHVTAKLIEKGFRVRGTVRNKAKGRRVLDAMAVTGVDISQVELVEAELGADEGWRDAVKDCRYIQHIASPFPLESPSDREALVPEARAGAQRVLENGFSAGAERIVLTSSMVAMMMQPGRGKEKTYDEHDWSDPDWAPIPAYGVSKTRAELSAWAYAEAQGFKDRLTTVNPGLVFGPDPFDNGGASLQVVRDMMNGEFPAVPKVAYPVVDVRDCASIHVGAMTAPDAAGRRLMAAGETLTFGQIADTLRAEYPKAKLPRGEAPNFALRLMSLFDDRIKTILPDLGHKPTANSAYVTSLTGVVPRPAKESLMASARDLIANGAVIMED
ncbi:NAD-dependent epimerase/dehydratase family protein [Algimonas porphyrae]|uniref:Dihydroflavonol-4-reductase n=1 Tax=Algimonas porphyrae TaxID=1128113 RepID=A0ABQ5V4H2_9PROT|nr:NAD-dependent epimerase/dehydratase family protein [Algimonas porphyrae]GLQ21864.1 dihydroflavonol-4-reductase [Algimonas porphyrae]